MAVKQTAGRDALGEFAPKFAELNDDVLFGEVWSRTDKLGLRDRSLVTITSLISQGITDNSLTYHLQSAKSNGITRTEIAEIITHIGFYAGWPKAWAAFRLAKEVWAEDTTGEDAKAAFQREMIFPIGEPNTAYAKYFIGNSYLAPISREQVSISNVTFEPGCRNNWHSHTGGQLLLVTAGRGYYQERGEPARLLLPGDVVEIAPDVEHWHGAAPDSWFAHLAVETNPQTNENRWLEPVDDAQYAAATAGMEEFRSRMSRAALRNFDALLPACKSELEQSDPELAEIVGNFAFDEVLRYGELDERTRRMTLLASAIALQAEGVYRSLLDAALDGGVTPVEVKEILYQAVPYVGLARTFDFIGIANDVLRRRGVALPLEGQSTVSSDDRFEKGLAVQRSIFGERIDRMHEEAPENQVHIQRYLSADCFGDYYTRGGLDVKTRELLTFSMLVSLGGCEAQVKGHIQGNANVGNGKATLLAVVTQLLPYIGYPRTLNAIACLNEVIPE